MLGPLSLFSFDVRGDWFPGVNGAVEDEIVLVGTASMSWSRSSAAPAIGVDVLDDSCIDAFPEESDDRELLFFKDDDAESKCLFFMSEEALVAPAAAAAAMVDDAS